MWFYYCVSKTISLEEGIFHRTMWTNPRTRDEISVGFTDLAQIQRRLKDFSTILINVPRLHQRGSGFRTGLESEIVTGCSERRGTLIQRRLLEHLWNLLWDLTGTRWMLLHVSHHYKKLASTYQHPRELSTNFAAIHCPYKQTNKAWIGSRLSAQNSQLIHTQIQRNKSTISAFSLYKTP